MPQTKAPNLLNDDGSASMATAFMMSHHGFRRDLGLLVRALGEVAAGDQGREAALREEWTNLGHKLHGHHEAEDNGIFPNIKGQHPELSATVEKLTADHRRIDPLFEKGAAAFAQLPATGAALAVVTELSTLLDSHLAIEEAEVIPHLRGATQFPPPASETELGLFAQGFAWASWGIAPDILQKLNAMLPAALAERLPAARAEYEAHCAKVWGATPSSASRTPIPDWLPG
jgi:hypothetical protein